MSSSSETLPHWDLSSVYPALGSPEWEADLAAARAAVEAARVAVSDERLRSENPAAWLLSVIEVLNLADGLAGKLGAYAYTSHSVATTDSEPLKQLNRVQELEVPLSSILVDFRNALAQTGTSPADLAAAEPRLEPYRFFIQETLEEQRHQMSSAEEALAADLDRSGGDAWSRLQATIASTLTAVWNQDTGEEKTVVQLRSLASDPERSVRQKAYRLELDAWKRMEIPIAAALNGVKGTSHTLNSRRGWERTLDRSIMQNRITRPALEAMISAMEDSLPTFRKYLGLKAQMLGLETLCWYDILAPVSRSERKWSFPDARDFILEQFGTFSDDLATATRTAFDSAWIDAEPRKGKVGGAYCIGFGAAEQIRVLANFDHSFDSLSTLAHELGHAYHNWVLRGNDQLLTDYPMTLAETASIFCETLVTNSALGRLSAEEGLAVLEASLQGSTQVIVDILSRFYFESELMEQRADHELSPDELSAMMLDAQARTYGPAVREDERHPYMWAVKSHYYRPGLAFYNFPYAFGLLFGLGLYSIYESEGPSFAERYRDLLTLTGRANAKDVVASVGFDIEAKDFWAGGLSVIARQVEKLAEYRQGS